mgnify:CR=1 FL=1
MMFRILLETCLLQFLANCVWGLLIFRSNWQWLLWDIRHKAIICFIWNSYLANNGFVTKKALSSWMKKVFMMTLYLWWRWHRQENFQKQYFIVSFHDNMTFSDGMVDFYWWGVVTSFALFLTIWLVVSNIFAMTIYFCHKRVFATAHVGRIVTTPPPSRTYPRVWRTTCPTLARTQSLTFPNQ